MMRSPSSSRTIRSTPWVEGCWGPMLRIISSVRNVPGDATSTSMPPPRTIQCSATVENVWRSCVSTGSYPPTRPAKAPGPPSNGPPARGRARLGPMTPKAQPPRRKIPSVDALLRSEPGKRAAETFGRALLKRTLTQTLDSVRAGAERGVDPPQEDVIMARAVGLASRAATGLNPVINATGVVLHTGLGRAPLPDRAAKAAVRAARGYSDLEIDRVTGARGGRTSRTELILAALTGAEGALVVNNGAAGLLLSLAALARGQQVLVSRGELIEIGGEFRIPDIMAASGAKLVEVGTTNRTRPSDYRSAIS